MSVLDAAAPRAFVVGWPITQSRSPLIHGHWLKEHGLAGSYQRLPVSPDAFSGFLSDLEAAGFVGGNVTVPHKETAHALCQELDPVAARLGAVNTVWLDDGRLHGANTDMHGFVANLDDRAPGWDRDPGPALVLGAGGAARAVIDGLLARGFEVAVANRTLGRAQAMCALFGTRVTAHELHEVDGLLGGARLVVNTTSVGMEGKEGEMALALDRLPTKALVTDIVYVPLETPLLAAARARGLKTVDGLGMLLHQAVPGFERWFGVKPTVTPALRRLILADLGVDEGDAG